MLLDVIKNVAIVGAGSFLGGAGRYLALLALKGIGLVALGYYLTR